MMMALTRRSFFAAVLGPPAPTAYETAGVVEQLFPSCPLCLCRFPVPEGWPKFDGGRVHADSLQATVVTCPCGHTDKVQFFRRIR